MFVSKLNSKSINRVKRL